MWLTYYSHVTAKVREHIRKEDFDDLHIVSLWKWQKIWREKFPDAKIRRYKQVTGKCWTCYKISLGRKKAGTRLEQAYYKKLFLCHRGGLFMLERKEYKMRAAKAAANPSRILSIIIDGMDQNHCRIPQTGTNLQYGGRKVSSKIYRFHSYLKFGI